MWLAEAQSCLIASYTSKTTGYADSQRWEALAKLLAGVQAVRGWVLTSCDMSHPPQRNTCLSRPLL
jgi:hypothetical protein